MAVRTEAHLRLIPGGRDGTCPFRGMLGDGPCGATADHWSESVQRYLCGRHYDAVADQFTELAVDLADGDCEDCGRSLTACRCGDVQER
ncbi:MAG: hypothetical protein NTZ05_20365 [Chloroflexi bacterium]|nr:hypothetical protein [Chloroflexota bacterium]